MAFLTLNPNDTLYVVSDVLVSFLLEGEAADGRALANTNQARSGNIEGETLIYQNPAFVYMVNKITLTNQSAAIARLNIYRNIVQDISKVVGDITIPVSGYAVLDETGTRIYDANGLLLFDIDITQPLTNTQLRAAAVPVSAATLPLPSGAATSANQTTEITALASILAKLLTAPSTEAKQDAANALLTTIAAKDFATQTTLAAILAKIIASPATAANQATELASLSSIDTKLSTPTVIVNGKKTVTIAGTRVALASSTPAKSVTIKALSANLGIIYVGDSTVAAANGFELSAKESVSIDIANLSTINLDASISGEGVSFIAIT